MSKDDYNMHIVLTKRFVVVFVLGFASGLPLALVTSTLQAWFADVGMSVYVTGMLSLLGLPYLYKFLWSPLLDRYSLLPKFGKRRSWILVTEILLCLGFNLMAWCAPDKHPILMVVLGFGLASLSATQDSVIDAFRIESLPGFEFGLGASVATLGYRLAILLSGGAALLIAQYVSWPAVYRIMGGVLVLGILATLWSDEKKITQPVDISFTKIFTSPVKNIISRPQIVPFCLFILFYKLGESFTTNISGIVMPFLIQGMGFSLATIAYVQKILGLIALIFGGLTAGVVLLRYSLFKSLLVFGLLQSITNALFVLLAMSDKSTLLLSIAVVSDNFAAGLGSTAIVALFMRYVDNRYTATQFAILAALAAIPRIFSGPIGAFLHAHFGWVGLYQIAFVLSFGFIPFLFIISNAKCFSREKNTNKETVLWS